MMSCKVSKWNKFNWQQERNFIITNHHIYNFNKKSKCTYFLICVELRRVIMISYLNGITKNINPDSTEFVIHVNQQPDYRLSCEKRNEFIDTLKLAFITLKRNNLKIFGIKKSKTLIDFVSQEKDIQNGRTRMPLALSRLYEEDLMSDEEVEKAKVEMRMNGMSIESPSSKITVDVNNYNQEDILVNIEHKQEAYQRKSSVVKGKPKPLPSPMQVQNEHVRGTTLYSRKKAPEDEEDVSKYCFEDFQIVRLIGKGTFGKVYLVQNKHNNKFFAMKSIRKDVVIDHDSLESLQVEKLILLQVRHPFIICLDHVFTKAARIYFVM